MPNLDGLIVVDKPAGLTSHDVILKIRKLLKIKRVGHTGTLDPVATGVLLLTVGRATRLFPYLSRLNKTYSGEIRLGLATDTYDAEGKPLGEENHNFPDMEKLLETINSLTGVIRQNPPPFSAKKISGQPAFLLARQGVKPELKPVTVEVYRFLVLDYQPPVVSFLVECSSGTYIRSLAHDLGQKLGCGAHLSSLRRIAVGLYTEEEALPLSKIEEFAASGKFEEFLIPVEKLLPEYPAIWLDPSGSKSFLHGARIPIRQVSRARLPAHRLSTPLVYRVFSEEDRLLGLATFRAEQQVFQPQLVFPPPDNCPYRRKF